MNPLLWTTEFMVKELRYNASLKKNGDRTMERAADRLEELQKERDEARGEVKRLEIINEEVLQANYTMATSRPEPSRLEIAAMLMAGGITAGAGYDALRYTDFLIAQAKQPK